MALQVVMKIVGCIQFGVYANFTNISSIFQTLGPQYNVLQVKSDSLLVGQLAPVLSAYVSQTANFPLGALVVLWDTHV